MYNITINELLEDNDIIAKLSNKTYEFDGIAYFVPKSEKSDNESWAKDIVHGAWIKRNWDSIKNRNAGIMNDIGKKIAGHGGIILEIGTGPGGGFMPYILNADPDAKIIISDLSPTVINEWKRFLDRELDSPGISYAAFNFCDIPFIDNCIDIVSDGGGIGNTESGERCKAFKECYRVLKPGGLLVTSTGFVNKETLAALPKQAQATLKEKRPDVFEDLYEETVLAGFVKIDSIISGSWDTDNDQSTIADLARSLGINLKFTSYVRYCMK